MRIVVVLPAALRPRKANVLPRSTAKRHAAEHFGRAKRFVNRLQFNRRFVHGFESSIVAMPSVARDAVGGLGQEFVQFVGGKAQPGRLPGDLAQLVDEPRAMGGHARFSTCDR